MIKNVKAPVSKKNLLFFLLIVFAFFLFLSRKDLSVGNFQSTFFLSGIAWVIIFGFLILTKNKLADLIYNGWIALGIGLGVINSYIILTFLFYFIFFPISLIAKLFGVKFIEDNVENQNTYFTKLNHQTSWGSNYEQQF